MYDIAQIKSRISCLDYAGRIGLPIHKEGDRCVSPLRVGATNKTSFVVRKDFFYDFASGIGGDVIEFCALYKHNGDRGAAIRELARMVGVTDAGTDNSPVWMEYTRNMNSRAAYYHTKLTDEDREYLHGRGLTDNDIDRLMIGRVSDGPLQGRLFLPYFTNGYCCYYATRAMPGGAFPDSKYRKQERDDFCQHIPWGMQTLNRPGDTLIIAEGYFDAASFECAGYPVLSAITGSFSHEQLPTVLAAARTFKNVFMVYDNDPRTQAGAMFTLRMARTLARNRIPFTVGIVPGYHDVSEYYADGQPLAALLSGASDGLEYLLKHDPDITSLSHVSQYSGAVCDYLNTTGCDAITSLILRLRPAVTEIESFMYSIARYTKRERLAYLFDQLERQGEFNPRWLQGLLKSVSQAPSERVVAEYIMEQHQLMYIASDAFYEYDTGCWRRRDDLDIKRYAIDYLGVFATDQRANAAKNLLKALCLAVVDFNQAPVWNFINGTLELNTGVFREPNPQDYCTMQMPYPYNPDASCPYWTRFIRDITADDEKSMEILQFIAGYTLFADCPYQKLFYLVGGGANGKSVFLDILVRLFGEANCTSVSPRAMLDKFQLVQLNGSVLNLCEEISGDLGDAAEVLKSVSSGGLQNACHKGQPFFAFRNRAKLVFASNEQPSSRDTSSGLARRLIIVNFPVQFVDNPDPNNLFQRQKRTDVTAPLIAEIATGAIFNWAYSGYQLLRSVGYFTETDDQAALMQDFQEVSNPLLVFWRENMEAAPPDEIGTVELYSQYRQWCDINGHSPLSRSRFHVEFKKIVGHLYERGERTERDFNGKPRKFRFYTKKRGLCDYCD